MLEQEGEKLNNNEFLYYKDNVVSVEEKRACLPKYRYDAQKIMQEVAEIEENLEK